MIDASTLSFKDIYLKLRHQVERGGDHHGEDEGGDTHDDGHVDGDLTLVWVDDKSVSVNSNQQDGEGREENKCGLETSKHFTHESLQNDYFIEMQD